MIDDSDATMRARLIANPHAIHQAQCRATAAYRAATTLANKQRDGDHHGTIHNHWRELQATTHQARDALAITHTHTEAGWAARITQLRSAMQARVFFTQFIDNWKPDV